MTPVWLLPEYLEDLLPPQAWRMEMLRRKALDLFHVWGYDLVQPPLLEYLESLFTGTGCDLDLRTFKVVDTLSGRMMGLRADHTPQTARIDAHLLNQPGVTRLCYAGPILHALPASQLSTREPFQVGAELYGHAGIAADIEIQELLLTTLWTCGADKIRLDIGHVGLYRALVLDAALDQDREARIRECLINKDMPGLTEAAAGLRHAEHFARLAQLYGGPEVLEEAGRCLPATQAIQDALNELVQVMTGLSQLEATISLDLGDLRGCHYHTGLVFSAFAEGRPAALAQGGRYDEVGRAFGRARPATGFSLDLREMLAVIALAETSSCILAPDPQNDPALRAAIEKLRAEGKRVVISHDGNDQPGCSRQLREHGGQWTVIENRKPKNK
jgi:ATP phosphoribosyltransferase regulatory subunit